VFPATKFTLDRVTLSQEPGPRAGMEKDNPDSLPGSSRIFDFVSVMVSYSASPLRGGYRQTEDEL
jgi:hypothetical protein